MTVRGARASRRRALVAVLVTATLGLGLGGPAAGPASAGNEIDHKLSAASDDLAAASKAVAAANLELVRARTLLPAAQAQASRAAATLASARAAYVAAQRREATASAQAVTAQQRLAAAQARIVEMNGQVSDLARAVYTQGPYAELAAVLSAATPSDFADGIQAVRSVSQSQNRTLADLAAAKADLTLRGLQAQQASARAVAARTSAAAALASASAASAQADAARARVAALIAGRTQALAVARREKATVAKQYAELKREQARLRALEHAHTGGYTGPVSGELFWPIPGAAVVQGVGPRIHPVYGYVSCHTGDDVRGTYGTPIHAAAAGQVIAVLNEGAYGLHTLISHGGGLSTMYAHQSRTAVHVGQVVARGEVIGYVGASGWVTGPHLHFEVHVDGVPYDPMGWFGGSKVPVSCWKG